MNCNDIRSLIEPLVDDELPTETTARVMEHVAVCPECQQEWDYRLKLRERFHRLADRIAVPSEALDRLNERLQQESRRAAVVRFWPSYRLSAAAALILVVAWLTWPNASPRTELSRGVREIIATYDFGPESAGNQVVPSSVEELSESLGFEVDPVSLPGWRLRSTDMVHLPGSGVCVARLTYVATQAGRGQKLVFYQSCEGTIEPVGLKEHQIAGRSLCCGERDGLSMVYWPGQGRDHLLVGPLPEKELMAIALRV